MSHDHPHHTHTHSHDEWASPGSDTERAAPHLAPHVGADLGVSVDEIASRVVVAWGSAS
jgi:hypothetical protein